MTPRICGAGQTALDTSGDGFTMTIAGQRHTTRADASHALRAWVFTHASATIRHVTDPQPLGALCEVAGHTITAAIAPRSGCIARDPAFLCTIAGVPRTCPTDDDPRPAPTATVQGTRLRLWPNECGS